MRAPLHRRRERLADTIALAAHEAELASLRESAAAAELAAARESTDVMLADAERRHGEALDTERRTHRAALEAAKAEGVTASSRGVAYYARGRRGRGAPSSSR